jgi:hypothetical protein
LPVVAAFRLSSAIQRGKSSAGLRQRSRYCATMRAAKERGDFAPVARFVALPKFREVRTRL